MAKWDKKYLELCEKILNEGVEVENRTGINTLKIPSYCFEFDLQEEFPILTTKQLFFKNAITELLWIYQVASNDVRWLQERNNNIWDEWEIDTNGFWKAEQMVVENGKLVKKTIEKDFGKKYAHTIGTAYGYIIDKYDLTRKCLNNIKNNPTNRRNVISLWQEEYLKTGVLEPCVWSTEWDVTDGKLNVLVHQRSCDVPLGLPFNVTQYAVLLNMFAHVCGLKPGKMLWSIKDAHIYVNQIDGIKEQILRGKELEDLKAPTLWLNPEIDDFFKFDNSKELKDIKILNYNHHGKIEFPIAK
ncbi:MAG TPA: thymidylate synthase [Tenericutes bacterium]|nr:thymidylate synthase [Mycoplasmatota bacterium]